MKAAKKYRFVLFVLLISLIVNFCTKDNLDTNFGQGQLKNLTGLDGCGWVIELNDGSTLEPVNLSKFSIPLVNGKKIWVSYHEAKGMASICMVGKIVEIDFLSE